MLDLKRPPLAPGVLNLVLGSILISASPVFAIKTLSIGFSQPREVVKRDSRRCGDIQRVDTDGHRNAHGSVDARERAR